MLAFDPPLINPEDITIPTCVPGADEAIALIRRHHEVSVEHADKLPKGLMTIVR